MVYSSKLKQFMLLSVLLGNAAFGDAQSDDDSAEQGGGNVSIDKLTKDNCLAKRTECCKQFYVGDKDVLMKCVQKEKMPDKNEKDVRKLAKFLSCGIECMYRGKNYIDSNDKLNMTMITADMDRVYAMRARERDYNVAMYDYCIKQGKVMYKSLTKNPAGKFLIADSCNPQLLVTFLCITEYHKEQECPYFKWEGKEATPAEEECALAQDRCYQLDKDK